MAYKTVICLLKVPEGEYCSRGDQSICDHLDLSQDPYCGVFEGFPRLVKAKDGFKKLARCLKLKNK